MASRVLRPKVPPISGSYQLSGTVASGTGNTGQGQGKGNMVGIWPPRLPKSMTTKIDYDPVRTKPIRAMKAKNIVGPRPTKKV